MGRTFSIKTRLVAVFALLLAAALASTAALTFQLTRSHLDRSLDESLVAAAESFRLGPAGSGRAGLAQRSQEWLSQQTPPGDGVLAVRVAKDRVIATQSEIELSAVPGSRGLLTSRAARMTVVAGPEGDLRALALPLSENGRYVGTFVAIAERSDVDETLGALLAGIGWAGTAALVLAVVLGAALVSAALRPLARISRSALEIERTGDLSQRVSAGIPPDEVGRLARSFDAMLERLQRSFSRQQSFLSDAAHEIRTPLTVARGQLEWLQDSLSSPDDKRVLASAVEEIDRVDRTVEDMLLLARLDEGATLVTEEVEIDLLLSEVALRALTLYDRRVSVEASEALRAEADERRLMQILENLVVNAIKYAGNDASVSMSARAEGSAVIVEVADTGVGIPADELERLFDRHYRGRATRGSAVPGAGLGLPIAKSLAEAMGGSISVRSTPGSGTVFDVRLRRVGSSDNVLGRRQRRADDYGSDPKSRRSHGEQRQRR